MKRIAVFIVLFSSFSGHVFSQKKPLDHTVYDSWQSISGVQLSHDGKYAVYNISPQEGDTALIVKNTKTLEETVIDRGMNAGITENSGFVVFRITPSQAEKKASKKKKRDEQPQDSLGWLKLATGEVFKQPKVKSFGLPEKSSEYFVFRAPMPEDTAQRKKNEKAECLVILHPGTCNYDTLLYVDNYTLSKNGNYIAYTTKYPAGDSTSVPGIYLYEPETRRKNTLMEGKGAYRLQSFDEVASQFAFFASTDTTKTEPKVYNLYYTLTSTPDVRIIADTLSAAMPDNWAVNIHRATSFSRNGRKLYFGISPVIAPKDTSADESEQAKLDIWTYMDDYLQPTQLKNLNRELNRSYLCVFDTSNPNGFVQLASEDMEDVITTDKGNAENALGLTTKGYRIESQWTGRAKNDVYVVSTETGEKTLVAKALDARPSISTAGNYIAWFDGETAQWYVYSVKEKTTRCPTENLTVDFADRSREVPDKPGSFGAMGWAKNDKYFYVYDKFDIWQLDPTGNRPPEMITKGAGRKENTIFRNIRLDRETEYIDDEKPLLLHAFENISKKAGYYSLKISRQPRKLTIEDKTFGQLQKAKNADTYVYTKANFNTCPDLWTTSDNWKKETQLSAINPQMKDYLWGTPELVGWKSKDGYDLQGILYKPENFDPAKKYPLLIYFYERHSDDLHRYSPPAPSRSTINIPFYVSRGYVVFTPDIRYVDGYPGRSAFNSIVAGAEMLIEKGFIDKKRIGIQGQSWGGYQTAYLVTQTDMFAAAGAGAPVSNMTSAYGGIRWETGLNRQMQYERQQSRIGKTLWDGLDLYIENSPLFFVDKIKTPILIMHNDNDGAVPWYQGIEYFTALKRLGKVAYLLQYNGEAHNLVHRRNTRDLSIRLQQFFDHYLKGDPMPVWMKSGVPATKKGKTWGLEY
ncbi:MAG: prolyl oligopeptidase family serine peptidase [Tannerella sp.]|jgi:dipeptidyl aminopeptidase/acylaminoacyl peptidase|nr:prolyl oligopeptidase family serine peptidase [Tannerella sp.]